MGFQPILGARDIVSFPCGNFDERILGRNFTFSLVTKVLFHLLENECIVYFHFMDDVGGG